MAFTTQLTNRTEVFDRNRLLIDLDEATDPCSPPSLLVVLELRGRGKGHSTEVEPEVALLFERLRDAFTTAVGNAGTTYLTRKTELCALIDGSTPSSDELLDLLDAELRVGATSLPEGVRIGTVELPMEAPDAITALTIADRRLGVSAAAAA